MTEQSINLAAYSRPSLGQRLLWALGFDRSHGSLDLVDWSCEETPGYAPGALTTVVTARFDWRDRLRLLLTGWAEIEVRTKTDVPVERAVSRSAVRVLFRTPR